ncbi:MAG: metallophosphoesterase [Deltaproteobacteria bacterium]|nr:MAG: metallophosphoesterase [Deltaproteobacteria bacterium]
MIFVKTDPPGSADRHEPLSGRAGFTLAHLSDPHLTAMEELRPADLLNKRAYGYLSWRLHRGVEHQDAVLSALLADIRSAAPGHIAVTGDLTHLGLPAEFRAGLKLLRTLGPPGKVTVIPGNHDAYVRTPRRRTFGLWSDYMRPDGDETAAAGRFPFLRIRGGIALIGVSTARPTLPFLATGRIGESQMERLGRVLSDTRERGLLRVVLMHHPPAPGTISRRKRLTDHAAFRALLVRNGAELILHGHTHRSSFTAIPTPWGKILSVGVPSASALGRNAGRRARYHLYRFGRDPDGRRVDLCVRVYSPEKRCFVTERRERIPLPGTTA